jgi:hypothetical protein
MSRSPGRRRQGIHNIHYAAIVASQIAMDIAVEAMVCQPGRKEVFIS